jgi:hypothetical protein
MIRTMQIVGGLLVIGYAAIAFSDYHFGPGGRSQIPASVRSSPGGYRSWSFWHSGEHGGK